ncbi:MAG: PAN domain-containing protein [Pyrinomonadaceae bacterium]|nr:PAN domain-containing protein [Pyrinomonadaceae bacterium]
MNKIKNLRKVFFTASLVGAALFSIFILSGLLAMVSSQDNLTVERDTDRVGGDYKNFDLSEAKYQLCRNACGSDSNCQAYTYAHPGIQGRSKAHCWLKDIVPQASASSCCISGVKTDCATDIFTGEWYSGEWNNISFTQDCNDVSGSYTRGGGTISGKVSGNRLNARWQNGNGKSGGEVYFVVFSNGTLEGKYCDNSGCNVQKGTAFVGRRR